jgi:hypothetical protein
MSKLRERMIQDLRLAGLEEGTQRAYLRSVRQLAAYYMLPPDQLSERQVEDYILYVRDELAVAKGLWKHKPVFAAQLPDKSAAQSPWPIRRTSCPANTF